VSLESFIARHHETRRSNSTKYGQDAASDLAWFTDCVTLLDPTRDCSNPNSPIACTEIHTGGRTGTAVGYCCSYQDPNGQTSHCKDLIDKCKKYYDDKTDTGELPDLSYACSKFCFETYDTEAASWCPYAGGYVFVAVIVFTLLFVGLVVLILVYWFVIRVRADE
jgi:hypothetical protein